MYVILQAEGSCSTNCRVYYIDRRSTNKTDPPSTEYNIISAPPLAILDPGTVHHNSCCEVIGGASIKTLILTAVFCRN